MNIIKLTPIVLLAGSIFLSSCKKNEDEAENSSPSKEYVEILLTQTGTGSAINAATVKTYATLDDFSNNQNVIESVVSDANGIAKLEPSNYSDIEYYIFASFNDGVQIDNWTPGQITFDGGDVGSQKRTSIVLEETMSSGLLGKKFPLTGYEYNGGDLYQFLGECLKDNYITIKGFKAYSYEGSNKCDPTFDNNGVPENITPPDPSNPLTLDYLNNPVYQIGTLNDLGKLYYSPSTKELITLYYDTSPDYGYLFFKNK